MAFHSTTQTITYDPTSSKYHVHYDGKTIKTTVTDKSAVTNEWVNEILSAHANDTMVVVGLDVEWRPHHIRSMSNKSATLQLCIDSKCLILQLFYMDEIPESLKRFLLNPKFTFVGIEVEDDVSKLKNEYGLDCGRSADIRAAAMKKWPGRFRRPGLKDLAMEVLGLHMKKPKHVCMSNWEARVLNENQVEYACIDAYASYKIAWSLRIESPAGSLREVDYCKMFCGTEDAFCDSRNGNCVCNPGITDAPPPQVQFGINRRSLSSQCQNDDMCKKYWCHRADSYCDDGACICHPCGPRDFQIA
ncbi:hypothetical protein SSX86_027781 [Deinandra increscens subsp. villosa]|uniref:3'-5' exonuclease domain-containing protein n=1 Tax=Deinandra increscens subsp. villosa TaxID=3103831 RepID=A0AAP0CBW0_9ASTR